MTPSLRIRLALIARPAAAVLTAPKHGSPFHFAANRAKKTIFAGLAHPNTINAS